MENGNLRISLQLCAFIRAVYYCATKEVRLAVLALWFVLRFEKSCLLESVAVAK